jgi:hypothetical protein
MARRVFGAHALWYLGYPDRGLQQCQDAMIFARALDHPPTLAFVSQIARLARFSLRHTLGGFLRQRPKSKSFASIGCSIGIYPDGLRQ